MLQCTAMHMFGCRLLTAAVRYCGSLILLLCSLEEFCFSKTAKQVSLVAKWDRKSDLCCKLLPGVLSIAIVSSTHDNFRHLFYWGVFLASEPLSGASQCCDWCRRVIRSRAVGKPSPGPVASARLIKDDDNCPRARSPAHVQDCNDG